MTEAAHTLKPIYVTVANTFEKTFAKAYYLFFVTEMCLITTQARGIMLKMMIKLFLL